MITISNALNAQKAIVAELNHLRGLESGKAWSYRSMDTPDAELKPNFDFEANHAEIKKLSKLLTKLSSAIAITNLECQLQGLSQDDLSLLDDWV